MVSCSGAEAQETTPPDAPLKETAAETPLAAPLKETAVVGCSAVEPQGKGRAQTERETVAGAAGTPKGVATDERQGEEVAVSEKQEAAAGRRGPNKGARRAKAEQGEKHQA